MKLYYVYIIRCKDEKLYIGITNNLDRRINEHNSGYNKYAYTYQRRPVTLVFNQEFMDVEQAIVFEKKIKKWSKIKKEALILGDFDKLKLVASCKNETNHKNKDL
ncbi:MAG: GIY-YIG nuclease family protein [Bacteroidales bacterium]|nr:GIY-YIG nuclease family protein [Bacteroidales bacterium]